MTSGTIPPATKTKEKKEKSSGTAVTIKKNLSASYRLARKGGGKGEERNLFHASELLSKTAPKEEKKKKKGGAP